MQEEICPICREPDCDFQTRCSHFYHKACLKSGNNLFNKPVCPYCTRPISLNKNIELIFRDPSQLEQFSNSPDVLIEILEYSVAYKNFEIFNRLCSSKADIPSFEKYASRCSAILKDSVKKGHLDIVKYLVEHGADIHSDNNYVLRCGALNDHLEIVKYLVEHGADIHADNDEALRDNASKGRLEIVKYLVEHGANISANNDYAREYSDVFEYLVEQRANTVLKNEILVAEANAHSKNDS